MNNNSSDDRIGQKNVVKTRQLLHAPSVIMVAICTVPMLITWLRGATSSGNDNDFYGSIRLIIDAILFDGVFSFVLILCAIIMAIALYCVVCINDVDDDFLSILSRKRRRKK